MLVAATERAIENSIARFLFAEPLFICSIAVPRGKQPTPRWSGYGMTIRFDLLRRYHVQFQ
jgi:hypothetical protein